MIEIKDLSKKFRHYKKAPGLMGSLRSLIWRDWNSKAALDNVSLQVEQGELVGLLGANGAGKTTLVKICSGIIHPTSGYVRVLGYDPWQRKNEFRKKISLIMGQKAQLWWDLPAADCFILLREIYQIPKPEFEERLAKLVDVLSVKGQLNTQIRQLSLGERMKMELVAALLHQPRMVFLDEPTIGLDISSQRALRKFITEYHQEHRPTIMLTSHYMEDIESLCKRIVIIREGGIVYDGGLKDLVSQYAKHKFLNVVLADEAQLKPNSLKNLSDIHQDLNNQWGEVVQVEAGELRIKVDRSRVLDVSAGIMQNLRVADLNISDPDVGTIVSQIQSETRV